MIIVVWCPSVHLSVTGGHRKPFDLETPAAVSWAVVRRKLELKTRSRSDLAGVVKDLWAWPKFSRAIFKICPPTTKMLGTALLVDV